MTTLIPRDALHPSTPAKATDFFVPTYEAEIRCGSVRAIEKGCEDLTTEVERILNASPFVGIFSKVVGVKIRQHASDQRKEKTKLFVTVEFEQCQQSEVHYLFSARPITISAPSTASMMHLVADLGRRDASPSFGGRSHGSVKVLNSLRIDLPSKTRTGRCIQFLFACAQSADGAVQDTSCEGTKALALAANG